MTKVRLAPCRRLQASREETDPSSLTEGRGEYPDAAASRSQEPPEEDWHGFGRGYRRSEGRGLRLWSKGKG